MRTPGLRLQLLLLLGGLLALGLLPLQLALATYTQVTLRQLDDAHAHALLSTLGAYVREASSRLPPDELISAIASGARDSGLVAASIDAGGRRLDFGEPSVVAALSRPGLDAGTSPLLLRPADRRVFALMIPTAQGHARIAVNAERASARGVALSRMFALYASLIALGLLTVAYFVLTRLIVRPLDALSQAAENVTLGSRQLAVPTSGVRELRELGESLKRMTDRLLWEEESLRKKIDEVERATVELEKAQSQVIRSERLASVGRLAAGLAHEIGNPIAALMGLEDLLLDGDLDPREQKDFIRRMRAETERIHRTLRDLLEFARPASPSSGGTSAPGDVEAAIHDTAALIVHQPSMRSLELRIDVSPDLPLVTLASERLIQVLLNLILNAADALRGQTGGQVAVMARGTERAVRIDVEDNGPGVPAEIAEQIFEPFFTTKEIGRGTGLGLSVCQGLVAAAGGTLSLDGSCPKGARFVVQLPMAERPVPR